jgi:hypothetical protein
MAYLLDLQTLLSINQEFFSLKVAGEKVLWVISLPTSDLRCILAHIPFNIFGCDGYFF